VRVSYHIENVITACLLGYVVFLFIVVLIVQFQDHKKRK